VEINAGDKEAASLRDAISAFNAWVLPFFADERFCRVSCNFPFRGGAALLLAPIYAEMLSINSGGAACGCCWERRLQWPGHTRLCIIWSVAITRSALTDLPHESAHLSKRGLGFLSKLVYS
jgi:hypothetical protein